MVVEEDLEAVVEVVEALEAVAVVRSSIPFWPVIAARHCFMRSVEGGNWSSERLVTNVEDRPRWFRTT